MAKLFLPIETATADLIQAQHDATQLFELYTAMRREGNPDSSVIWQAYLDRKSALARAVSSLDVAQSRNRAPPPAPAPAIPERRYLVISASHLPRVFYTTDAPVNEPDTLVFDLYTHTVTASGGNMSSVQFFRRTENT